MSKTVAKIEIENVLQPGKTYSADPAKYEAMKKAVLAVLPKKSPGLTVADVQELVLAHLPQDLFPDGAKSGWWMKAVQLDPKPRESSVEKRHPRLGCTGVKCALDPLPQGKVLLAHGGAAVLDWCPISRRNAAAPNSMEG